MAKVILVHGSVFGGAELTADEIEDALTGADHEVIRPDPATAADLLDTDLEWLIVCCSSTGNGDVPDNLVPFYTELVNDYPRITHLKYAVVALGDSSYDTFCGGGLTLDAALLDLGARQMAAPLKIDALEITEPEEFAPPWVVSLIETGAAPEPDD